MTWEAVLNNPLLRNLPFKIEMNRFGQIVMNPASNKRGAIKAEIGFKVWRQKKQGKLIFGCSMVTSDGIKVADVAWASDEFIEEYGEVTPYPKAPEICVEVISPSNSKQEIEHKVELYLAKGALEVWVVDGKKQVAYYTHIGKIPKSKLVPKIKL
ncbi:MAG: Uma2 family endonuclease [Acidobacteriota bacterium]|nr:Uma2 family endonuclease [Acidobacteriota bacterium]